QSRNGWMRKFLRCFKNFSPSPFYIKKREGSVNCVDLLSFRLTTIGLIFFCDDWRNLRENYSARVAVGFGCGLAALDCTKAMLTIALVYGNPLSINKR
ncbi:hypothetical protein, partial [Caldithrix abyssi]